MSQGNRDRSKNLERRIIQCYIWALRSPETVDGGRAVTLERHVNYEVRLIEPSDTTRDNEKAFWIELVDDVGETCLDSYGSDDLEQIERIAEEFIERAQLLSSSDRNQIRK